MSRACNDWRGEIGAYIVGALDHAAGVTVRRHLRSCSNCRSEYEDLLPVRDWLTRLSLTDGSAVRRRVSGPVLRLVKPIPSGSRRRWLATAVAAAAAAAIGVFSSIGGNPSLTAFRATDRATGVHGQARLHATAAGTRISLSVTGLAAGERCLLIAVSPHDKDTAATWTAKYDGSARIVGTSAIPADRLTALRVESASHQVLLVIRLAAGSRR
jgi:hypothetical protein